MRRNLVRSARRRVLSRMKLGGEISRGVNRRAWCAGRGLPRTLTLVLAAAFASGGCQHAAPPPEQTRSAVRFVEPPPPAAKPKTTATPTVEAPTRRVLAAEPIEPLALPAYPNVPRGERPPVALVALRITIDATGRVSDIGQSLRAFSSPHARATEYRAAAEAALAQWRFRPAETRQLEVVPATAATPAYLRASGFELIEWTYDVVFTFNASGEVGWQR